MMGAFYTQHAAVETDNHAGETVLIWFTRKPRPAGASLNNPVEGG